MRRRAATVLALAGVLVSCWAGVSHAETGVISGKQQGTPLVSAAQKHRLTPIFAASAKLAVAKKSTVPEVPGLDPNLADVLDTDGTTPVNVRGSVEAVTSAVVAVGGTVQATVPGAVSATVPTAALVQLARGPGVTAVAKPVKAFTNSTTSQGVAASGASPFIASGYTGAGVTIAIVDAGFAQLTPEVQAGNLPAGLTLNANAPENMCGSDLNVTNHGTAVAETIHQMAPAATLKLYCIQDTLGFQQAGAMIQAADIKIVNSSLSFPGDDRGDADGTSDASTSAAATIKAARQAGILWIQSAGNAGVSHWTGDFAPQSSGPSAQDPSGTWTALDSQGTLYDSVLVPKGASAQFFLQWDDWPTSNYNVSLAVAPVDSGGNLGSFVTKAQIPGHAPVVSICFQSAPATDSGCVDTSGYSSSGQLFAIGIKVPYVIPSVRFDLDYEGYVSMNSLSCPTFNANRTRCLEYNLSPSSIAQPASSKYAFAVGAVDASGNDACQADLPGTGTYPLQNYSSRGPTIDGRPKPDIAGFDATTGSVANPFCGTSASAPHVAGAAAIALQLNPTLTADDLQNYLQAHATPAPAPPNTIGAGVLNLGPRALSKYQALPSPVRILDTRTAVGGRPGVVNGGETITVPVSAAQVPSGATAVAINLTGTGASAPTYLTTYAAGAAPPLSSNVNVAPGPDSTAAAFAIVSLGVDESISVYNGTGAGSNALNVIIDVLGYLSLSATGGYTAVGPTRIVDTRTGLGGVPVGAMGDNSSLTVSAGQAGAKAALVNVTSANSQGAGHLSLSPDGSDGSSTVNFAGVDRANLTVVALDANGQFKIRSSGASTHVVIDVVATFGPSGNSGYFGLGRPIRILDSRYGTGGINGPIGPATSVTLSQASSAIVPANASAIMVGATAVNPTAPSFLEFYPSGAPATTSTLNFTPSRTVANAAAANLSSSITKLYNNVGSVDAIVDLSGYFAPIS